MLKLKIENFDKLPDGGPLEFSVDRRGFDVGRESHLDWTLPDANRVVSGKHCEIRFHEDAYWLVDVSTNGTYVNDSDKRVQSPYRLQNGDRLGIGEYLIAVSVSVVPERVRAARQFEPIPVEAAAVPARGASVWDTGHEAPPAIDSRDLMPPPPAAEQAPAFLNQAMFVPEVIRPEPPPPDQAVSMSPPLAAPAPPPQAAAVPLPPTSAAFSQLEWKQAVAKGAGLPRDAFERLDPQAFATELGQLLRIASSELMVLLQSRAEAKALARGGRTMLHATENNPLKFVPTVDEAMQAMLTPRGKGYLSSTEAFEKSFADLKHHQIATLAAMQTAAKDLLKELSPQAVAKASQSKKSLLGNVKAAQWDEIVRVWTSKAGNRENGMLDVFLDLFADNYEKFGKRKN